MNKHIRFKKTRGFYEHRQGVWIRNGFHTVTCDGEAHSNGHIDFCGVCAPLWGECVVPDWVISRRHYNDAYFAWRAIASWLLDRPV
jgi:hypothetical protein